jgi:hypothetical protein
MTLGVDHLHQERSGANRPRVRIELTLADDFPSRMDLENHEGEWIVGHVHLSHHSFASATLPSIADTLGCRTR